MPGWGRQCVHLRVTYSGNPFSFLIYLQDIAPLSAGQHRLVRHSRNYVKKIDLKAVLCGFHMTDSNMEKRSMEK
jgi:hypothetical protein